MSFYGEGNFEEKLNKLETVRFRIDAITKQHWNNCFEKLGVSDFSSYARRAVEKTIQEDFRSTDPKWKAFLKEIKPIALKRLGFSLSTSNLDYSKLKENEDYLLKVGTELSNKKGLKVENIKPLPGQDTEKAIDHAGIDQKVFSALKNISLSKRDVVGSRSTSRRKDGYKHTHSKNRLG